MGKWLRGQPYTTFKAIRVKETIGIFAVDSGGYSSVMSMDAIGADRTMQIADASGSIAVVGSGTFVLNMPAIKVGGQTETIATISGLAVGDPVFVTISDPDATIFVIPIAAWVSGANSLSIELFNTGSAAVGGSGVLSQDFQYLVIKK